MYRSLADFISMRYFVGFFIALGLVILLIVLLVGGGGGKNKLPVTNKTLPSYANTDATATLTIDGPIRAIPEHRQVRISVSQDEVIYEQIVGYNDQVVYQQHYNNTEEAYSSFLHALDHAGFAGGIKDKALASEAGYCPLGNRYVYEFEQTGRDIIRTWATSCGKPKTYNGVVSLTNDLFEAQVPNYQQQASRDTGTPYSFALD
jgi:hypothetical protein